jgi:hypothetical protein
MRYTPIALVFLVFAILFSGIGGYLDITQQEKWGCISKEHLWHDGILLAILSVFLLHFK